MTETERFTVLPKSKAEPRPKTGAFAKVKQATSAQAAQVKVSPPRRWRSKTSRGYLVRLNSVPVRSAPA